MTKKDLRMKLQVLIGEFQKEHKLDIEEIHTIVTTITTLIYSEKPTRLIWYREMQRVSEVIARSLKEQVDMILAALDMSDKEKEKLMKSVKAQVRDKKEDKVEN